MASDHQDDPAELFDLAPAQSTRKLSADQRRTLRQAACLTVRTHPLSIALNRHLGLHPEAAPADDRNAPGRRCGNCRYRDAQRYHARTYPKCSFGWQESDPRRLRAPRMSNGAGTDVRAWWPACTDHEYGDPGLSPDAARYVPSTDREDTSSA